MPRPISACPWSVRRTVAFATILNLLIVLAMVGCNNQQQTAADGEPTAVVQTSESPTATEDPADAADQAKEQPPIEIQIGEPNNDEPVMLGAGIAPAQLQPGGEAVIEVRAKMAPTWHIYATDQPPPSIATSFDLQLPDGVASAGDWQFEPAEVTSIAGETAFVYHDVISFRKRLSVGSDVPPGTLEIICAVQYQACTDSACLPPNTTTLAVEAEVVADDD